MCPQECPTKLRLPGTNMFLVAVSADRPYFPVPNECGVRGVRLKSKSRKRDSWASPMRLKEWTQFSSPHMKWQTECQYLHPDFLRTARAALDWAIRTKQGHCIHKWANAASIDCAHTKGGDAVPCGWASFSKNSYFLSSGFWTQHLVGVRELKSEGHTVYFLISSFECEWFKLVWPNWSREAKISLSYLTHVCERSLSHRLVQGGSGDAHGVLSQITLCHRWPDPRECIIDVKEFW